MTDTTEALPPLPDRELASFIAWAAEDGRDTAHAFDTDRSRWVFWNPMTADLWSAWLARAALAQRPQAPPSAQRQQVPEGWKLVPVEPTVGMLIAGSHCQPGDYSAALVWKEMIASSERSRELRHRLERSVALASAHTAPSARPAERKGCDYIAPLGSLCRKCGHVHGQRYTFWTGDGEAAMQPDPNGNWLWLGDPAKAPKGL